MESLDSPGIAITFVRIIYFREQSFLKLNKKTVSDSSDFLVGFFFGATSNARSPKRRLIVEIFIFWMHQIKKYRKMIHKVEQARMGYKLLHWSSGIALCDPNPEAHFLALSLRFSKCRGFKRRFPITVPRNGLRLPRFWGNTFRSFVRDSNDSMLFRSVHRSQIPGAYF